MIVERRRLSRNPTLEALCQAAIDTVHAEVIVPTVQDALDVVLNLPADLQRRGLKHLRDRVNKALGACSPEPVGRPVQSARQAAEAVFVKDGRAA